MSKILIGLAYSMNTPGLDTLFRADVLATVQGAERSRWSSADVVAPDKPGNVATWRRGGVAVVACEVAGSGLVDTVRSMPDPIRIVVVPKAPRGKVARDLDEHGARVFVTAPGDLWLLEATNEPSALSLAVVRQVLGAVKADEAKPVRLDGSPVEPVKSSTEEPKVAPEDATS